MQGQKIRIFLGGTNLVLSLLSHFQHFIFSMSLQGATLKIKRPFWNGSHAIPMQRGLVFTKIIRPQKWKLGRIFDNFLFFFLKPNQREGKFKKRERELGRKKESTCINTILMSNIGNYIHC